MPDKDAYDLPLVYTSRELTGCRFPGEVAALSTGTGRGGRERGPGGRRRGGPGDGWGDGGKGGRGPAELGPGQRYRLEGGVHAELASQVVQVRVDGLQRHMQLPGHLALSGTFGEMRQDLPFPGGEGSEHRIAAERLRPAPRGPFCGG